MPQALPDSHKEARALIGRRVRLLNLNKPRTGFVVGVHFSGSSLPGSFWLCDVVTDDEEIETLLGVHPYWFEYIDEAHSSHPYVDF